MVATLAEVEAEVQKVSVDWWMLVPELLLRGENETIHLGGAHSQRSVRSMRIISPLTHAFNRLSFCAHALAHCSATSHPARRSSTAVRGSVPATTCWQWRLPGFLAQSSTSARGANGAPIPTDRLPRHSLKRVKIASCEVANCELRSTVRIAARHLRPAIFTSSHSPMQKHATKNENSRLQVAGGRLLRNSPFATRYFQVNCGMIKRMESEQAGCQQQQKWRSPHTPTHRQSKSSEVALDAIAASDCPHADFSAHLAHEAAVAPSTAPRSCRSSAPSTYPHRHQ